MDLEEEENSGEAWRIWDQKCIDTVAEYLSGDRQFLGRGAVEKKWLKNGGVSKKVRSDKVQDSGKGDSGKGGNQSHNHNHNVVGAGGADDNANHNGGATAAVALGGSGDGKNDGNTNENAHGNADRASNGKPEANASGNTNSSNSITISSSSSSSSSCNSLTNSASNNSTTSTGKFNPGNPNPSTTASNQQLSPPAEKTTEETAILHYKAETRRLYKEHCITAAKLLKQIPLEYIRCVYAKAKEVRITLHQIVHSEILGKLQDHTVISLMNRVMNPNRDAIKLWFGPFRGLPFEPDGVYESAEGGQHHHSEAGAMDEVSNTADNGEHDFDVGDPDTAMDDVDGASIGSSRQNSGNRSSGQNGRQKDETIIVKKEQLEDVACDNCGANTNDSRRGGKFNAGNASGAGNAPSRDAFRDPFGEHDDR
jgi:hypothetical protein